jgi:hypothetical protein
VLITQLFFALPEHPPPRQIAAEPHKPVESCYCGVDHSLATMKVLAAILGGAGLAAAHGYIDNATIGGQYYQFYQPYTDPYTSPTV